MVGMSCGSSGTPLSWGRGDNLGACQRQASRAALKCSECDVGALGPLVLEKVRGNSQSRRLLLAGTWRKFGMVGMSCGCSESTLTLTNLGACSRPASD